MSNEVVVIVAGGPGLAPGPHGLIPSGAPVIAADGGIEHARRLGLEVSLLVGDLDSAPAGAVSEAEAGGIRVERHPPEKDATDLELALDAALELEPRRILVLASDRGRLDHLLSTLLLLGSLKYEAVEVGAWVGRARIDVVRRDTLLEGRPGDLVTLLALHGQAHGIRTEGLVYPLDGEVLEPGSSRGVSNVFAAPQARISVEDGVLLVIRPGPEEETQ